MGVIGLEMGQNLTTRELAALAGITERMLRWWVDRGLIRARRKSHTWRYDDRQALAVLILGRLRRKNIPLHEMHRLKLLPVRGDFLVVLGQHVHWFSGSTLIRRLERAASGCLVVDVRELREMLERRKSGCNAVSPPRRRIAA